MTTKNWYMQNRLLSFGSVSLLCLMKIIKIGHIKICRQLCPLNLDTLDIIGQLQQSAFLLCQMDVHCVYGQS